MSDSTALQTLEGKLLDPATDIMLASALAAGVEKLVEWVRSAKSGTVTPGQALAAMNATLSTLDTHHAAAMASAKAIEDARFPIDEVTPTP